MISQALRIHESTVVRHLSDYVLLSLKMVVAKADFLLGKPCNLSKIWLRKRTFIPIELSLMCKLSLVLVIPFLE